MHNGHEGTERRASREDPDGTGDASGTPAEERDVDPKDQDASREDDVEAPDRSEAGMEGSSEGEVDSEVERLRTEVSDLNDRHLRLAAEFDNYRRRSRAELDDSRARAQADLVGEFLEVLDDLERVRDVDPEGAAAPALLEGVEMVERKFVKVLEGAGVEAIDPRGEPFDPEFMEAMTTVPAESDEEDDRVHQVFQKGYRLDGHLIRPARVSVLKTA